MHYIAVCDLPCLSDMGNGQPDDSQQATSKQQQPALNTTQLLNKYLSDTDLVLHIGDISYANGYSSVVSCPLCTAQALAQHGRR